MNENILNVTKKLLGLSEEDESFDTDIIIGINSAVATLAQLGATSVNNITVSEDTEYEDLVSNEVVLNMVKQYIYMKTRLAFDPPNSAVQSSFESQIRELEWRIYTWSELFKEEE